jgi:hypothetical protein
MEPRAELPAAARARARTGVRRGFWEAVSMVRGLFPSDTRKRARRFLFGFGSQEGNSSRMRAQHRSKQGRFRNIRRYIRRILGKQAIPHPQVCSQTTRSFPSVSAAPARLRCHRAAVELRRRSVKPLNDYENVPNARTPSRQRTARRSGKSLPKSSVASGCLGT